MVLADMGAEVLKIEAPDAAEAPSRPAPIWTAARRAWGWTWTAPRGRKSFTSWRRPPTCWWRAISPAPCSVSMPTTPPLSRINPRLIYCSLSGYGQTGPRRGLPGSDITLLAESGVLDLIGEVDRPPAIPLNLIADYGGAAMHGAAGILMALYARGNSGLGQHVDVSHLDATLSMLAASPLMEPFFDRGVTPRRGQGAL